MTIEEYKEQLYQDILASANANIMDATSEFLKNATDILVNAEEIEDFTECYFEMLGKRSRRIQIDGYHIDEIDRTCCLFISNFTNDYEMTTINDSQIEVLYRKMEAFVDHSLSRYIEENAEEASSGYELSLQIAKEINSISKFRFFIITDQMIGKRVKALKKEDIHGKPVELNVWDINRLFELEMSFTGKEQIEIEFSEFGVMGLPCVKGVESEAAEYKAYLTTISGDLLAKIYLEYGARLLEGNVRSFLSNKSNVNKAIRNTIIKNPEMFFAYNNGIAATASEIEYIDHGYGMMITKIKDLQIINGGQTTASIANAVLNKEGNVEKVVVPMKLSVVNKERAEAIIPEIAKCANSQNKIDEADFASNHPFNIRMEEFSRRTLPPAVDGNQFGKGWFFERARGQYVQAQMRLTRSERNTFTVKWPKNQIIKKVDFAKYMMSFDEKPHVVSKGAQACASMFHQMMIKEWDKSNEKFNSQYYKNVIALSILYKGTEKLVSEQEWYKATKSYRANIVAYTLAVLFYNARKNARKEIDLKKIWLSQKIYFELERQIEVTSEEVFSYITSDDRVTLNVTQWCKQEGCWERAKKERWTINDDFLATLVSHDSNLEEVIEAKATQRVHNEVDVVMEVVKFNYEYWNRMNAWATEKRLLSPIEKDFIKLARDIEYTGNLPTPKQAKRIVEIHDKILMEGFQ